MQPIKTLLQIEYEKLIKARIEAIKLQEKIDKRLAKIRGLMNGKY